MGRRAGTGGAARGTDTVSGERAESIVNSNTRDGLEALAST